MKLGFIGLGRMGSAVAQNLIKAGHQLTVWNRSPAAVEVLVAKGAAPAKSPDEAMQGEATFSMLANDRVMDELGFAGPLLARARKGLIHVNMATISVGFAQKLAKAHGQAGLHYVGCPVFGRPDAAAAAQLVLIAAGPPDSVSKMTPLFERIGSRTVVLGEEPHKANLFKVAGNFMIASQMEAIGEAFALLRKAGVDAEVFHDVLGARLFSGLVFKLYGSMILRQQFEPAGFALTLGLKDTNLVREAAAELGVNMPSADLIKRHYEEALAWGWQDKDWSALAAVIARTAGL